MRNVSHNCPIAFFYIKYFTLLPVCLLGANASKFSRLVAAVKPYELQDRGSSILSLHCVECLFQYFIEVHMKFF